MFCHFLDTHAVQCGPVLWAVSLFNICLDPLLLHSSCMTYVTSYARNEEIYCSHKTHDLSRLAIITKSSKINKNNFGEHFESSKTYMCVYTIFSRLNAGGVYFKLGLVYPAFIRTRHLFRARCLFIKCIFQYWKFIEPRTKIQQKCLKMWNNVINFVSSKWIW